MAIKEIHRATLQTWLTEGSLSQGVETGLLDLRNEADFAKGHPLFATNVPLRRLEAEASAFVPRKDTRLVLVDGGDKIAHQGAEILARLGYTDINVLRDGIPGWLDNGGNGSPTFDIPGVIFATAVQDVDGTPGITVDELAALQARKADIAILDTRTPPEFELGHVPGARNLPVAELLQRFLDYVPSPDTRVIVSCAGLPRAILGAQTLISAGVPNEVVYLIDGTPAWTRSGRELESGHAETFAHPSSKAVEFGLKVAEKLVRRGGLKTIDRAGIDKWSAESGRTTYVLDVRLPHEYAQGHLPGALSSPGGQLIAVSHRTVAVRGARIVLVDDTGTRAKTTAFWLARRGWEVRVHTHIQAEAEKADTRREFEPS